MGTASSRENDTKRSFSLCAKPDKNVKTETKILCIQDFLTVESKLVQGSTLQSRGPRGTGRFYMEPFLEPLPLKPRLLQQASRNPLWFTCVYWVEDTCAFSSNQNLRQFWRQDVLVCQLYDWHVFPARGPTSVSLGKRSLGGQVGSLQLKSSQMRPCHFLLPPPLSLSKI